MKKRMLLLPAVILICAAILSFGLGQFHVSPGEIFRFFSNRLCGMPVMDNERMALLQNVLIDIRLPRIAAAILIGAALSVSGASYQALFINPLVSPGLLGVLAGASFGAAFGMIFSSSWFMVQLSTLLFGFLAVIVASGIARIYHNQSVLILVLGGIISGSFFTALLSLMKYIADPYNELPAIVYWLMGSLAFVDTHTIKLITLPSIAGVILIVFHGRQLNAISMGEEEASSLGVNVRRTRLIIIASATLISALTVVVGGMIGWVGLIIPHICRMLFGPDNEILLPASCLVGGIYLLLIDNISRLAFSFEIPIGIITALIGIPFFTAVLKNSNRGWR
jgi:iron complex transport system permease protein